MTRQQLCSIACARVSTVYSSYWILVVREARHKNKMDEPLTSATPVSHADWANSNLEKYKRSVEARQHSKVIRNETIQVVEDQQIKTNRSQNEASDKLNDRASDITTWKNNLQRELLALVKETEDLRMTRRELEHAIEQAKRPEEVVNHCVTARKCRIGIDNVTDAVQVALTEEIKEIERIQKAMGQHHDDIEAQILKNELVAEQLKVDLRQKIRALDIDQTCFSLDNTSHEMKVHPGVHKAELTVSSPESWTKFSDKNIEDSNNARTASAELRGNVDGLLSSACTELMTAWSVSNRSFKERVMETEETQGLLSKNLLVTSKELEDLGDHIRILKKALDEKRPPLKVAETRLALRTHRPILEACDDSPQGKLVDEVVEINDSINILTQKLSDAESARAQLLKAKAELREDLRVKETSLTIDRVNCLGPRLRFPYNQRCSNKCFYKWCFNIASFTMNREAGGLHFADTDLRQ